ncbi:MAG: hypothetical protein AAF416_15600 [Pseudomonadota bacterium]
MSYGQTIQGGMIRAALILSALLASPAAADVRVIDGDSAKLMTITITLENITVRSLWGDTPEIRGDCPMESLKAAEATEAFAEYVRAGAVPIHHSSFGIDRFGRPLVVWMLKGRSVMDLLIERSLAVPSDGPRHDWCHGAPIWSPLPVGAPR